jgi:hypothetical protein
MKLHRLTSSTTATVEIASDNIRVVSEMVIDDGVFVTENRKGETSCY